MSLFTISYFELKSKLSVSLPDSKSATTQGETNPPAAEDDALSRTFEMEDDNLLFKTPVPPKFFKREEFKTPMSSVFSRFQNLDDQNDSFVENERTIMLQFRNEAASATKVTPNRNVTCEAMSGVTAMLNTVSSATSESTSNLDTLVSTNANSTIGVNEKSHASITNKTLEPCTLVNTTANSIVNTTAHGDKTSSVQQLAIFVQQQRKALNAFIEKQNAELNAFIANMGSDTALPSVVISEQDCTTIGNKSVGNTTKEEHFEGGVKAMDTLVEDTTLANMTRNATLCDTVNETLGTGDSTANVTVGSGNVTAVAQHKYVTRRSVSVAKERKDETIHEQPEFLSSTQLSETLPSEDTTTHFRPKTRQSIAFSNFKRNCSILKTPSQNRKSMANTTAVFTPGSLSVCIRDQLEALENEED